MCLLSPERTGSFSSGHLANCFKDACFRVLAALLTSVILHSLLRKNEFLQYHKGLKYGGQRC